MQVTNRSVNDIRVLEPGWKLSLRSENKSQATITAYSYAVTQLAEFLEAHGMPLDADKIAREHLEAFLVHKRETTSASTAETRYRGLRQFFSWLEAEGEITSSPMRNMRPPQVGEAEVYVPTKADVEAILTPLRKSNDWVDRRDVAIISLFAGSGMRLSELTNLAVDDIDLTGARAGKGGLAKVTGMGDRFRLASFRDDVANDLRRWLRARAKHLAAHGRDPEQVEPLWVGLKGNALTQSGIRQMVWKRSEAAGIPRLHPHSFRHHFANEWLRSGKSEGGLMSVAGWKTRAMIDEHYAIMAKADRAIEEHLRD